MAKPTISIRKAKPAGKAKAKLGQAASHGSARSEGSEAEFSTWERQFDTKLDELLARQDRFLSSLDR